MLASFFFFKPLSHLDCPSAHSRMCLLQTSPFPTGSGLPEPPPQAAIGNARPLPTGVHLQLVTEMESFTKPAVFICILCLNWYLHMDLPNAERIHRETLTDGLLPCPTLRFSRPPCSHPERAASPLRLTDRLRIDKPYSFSVCWLPDLNCL